jgi:transcriptional regulator NrdR family protein
MGRPYKCPHCKSTNTIWKGHRKLRNGRVRLRKCQQCNKKWTTRQFIADAIGGAP